MREFGVVTTRTILMVVFVTVLMLGLPSIKFGDQTIGTNPIGDAAASPGDRSLKVSVVDLTGAVSTLNPLLFTETAEWDVVYPCYSQLLQYDLEGTSAGNVGGGNTFTGDLATSWDVSPDGLTYHFELTHFAKFYNRLDPAGPSQNHPFTADDVIYTFWLIQNTTSNLMSYFPILDGQKLLKNMWAPDPYNLYITTSFNYAPFLDALGTIPILPKYIWNQYAPMNPTHGTPFAGWNTFSNFDISANIAPCVGTGMFFYLLNGLPSTGQNVELDRNPQWYATEEKGWQVHVNKLIWTSETSSTSNLNDFTAGVTDVMMYVTPTQFSQTLTQPSYSDISKWGSSLGYVYEFNLNQMTDAQRTQLGGKYGSGKNNQLLLDPTVKLAMQMCIDKNAYVDQVLHGLGQPADSIVPPVNPYHYTYGSSSQDHVITFDPAGARTMLNSAGWRYDTAGNLNPGATPLCQIGGTSPLQFKFYTPSNEAEYDSGARLIISWMAQAGIDLSTGYAIKSVNQMNGYWAAADYDTWLWNWEWSALAEVSVDVMQVFTTKAIGSWSDLYWSNATYDALYNKSLVLVDRAARKVVTDEMQRMIYDEHACQTPAYKQYMYAASSRGPDQWTNWGNWSKNWLLIPDQHVAPYLYMQIYPKDNPAPKFTSFQKTYEGTTTGTVAMTGSVDQTAVQYRWFYGDGTRDPSWTASALRNHLYSKDGIYTAYLAVRQTTGSDLFVSVNKTVVTVMDMSNQPPTNVGFSAWSRNSPGNPDTGSIVYLNGTATDPENDQLFYSWDFGDGLSASGQNVTHQFTQGSSTVTLSVDDHRIGFPLDSRPVNHPGLIAVTTNTEPSISVPDVTGPIPKQSWTYWVTTFDSDVNDLHTYTWVWGDGSITVTKTAPLVNNTISTAHTYANAGIYSMVVYADDQTGLPEHNKSGSGQVLCRRGIDTAPAITTFSVSLNTPVRFQNVTFTGTASDADADNMFWTWDFGDGTNSTVYVPVNNKNPVTRTVTHNYLTSGIKVARLYVSDGFLTATSNQAPMNVGVGDHEPVVQALPSLKLSVGKSHSYACSATDVDGDLLTYWWQFGDGTNMSGQSVTKTFSSGTGQFGTWYRVWVNDNNHTSLVGPMNVSVGNTVTANWIPWITRPLSNVDLGATFTAALSISAMDNDTIENTSLLFTWSFGDGTVLTGRNETIHEYPHTLSPMNYTVVCWVNDGFIDQDGVTHNISTSAVVHVEAPSFDLVLIKGWNFVTVPSTGGGYRASNLPGLAMMDSISSWNVASQTYDKTYIKGITPPSGDFEIAPSTGYWINVGANRTAKLTLGTIPMSLQTRTITLPGSSGWVNLAFNTLNATWKASMIPGMYSGGTVTSVSWYNPVSKTYKTYIPGVPPSDFTLTPGQAYWISVSGGGTFAYTP